MQRWFVVLTLPFLLFGLTAAHKKSDREEEALLGPVHSTSSQYIRLSPGEPDKKGRPQQQDTISYDTHGNEAGRTIYDDYGFLVGRQVNKHDPNGHLIESLLSDPDGAVMMRQVYAYSDGKLSETSHYGPKGEVGLREVNRYDANGRLSEGVYYEEEKEAAKTVYRYDGAGRRAEAVFYMADGSKAVAPVGPCLGAHRMTYSYDENGRPHEAVAYEPDGTMKKRWLYAYNEKGLMSVEKLEDDYDYTTRLHAYEYDSRGNWIKRISTVTEKPKPRQLEFERSAGIKAKGETRDAGRMIISRKIDYY